MAYIGEMASSRNALDAIFKDNSDDQRHHVCLTQIVSQILSSTHTPEAVTVNYIFFVLYNRDGCVIFKPFAPFG